MVFTPKKPFLRCWNQASIPISIFVTSFKCMATLIYITAHPTSDEDMLQKNKWRGVHSNREGGGNRIQKRNMTNKKLQRKPFVHRTPKDSSL